MMLLLPMLAGIALADEPDKVSVTPTADLWMAAQQVSSFAANADGAQGGQGAHLNGRQIIGILVGNQDIGFDVAMGVQQHQLAGATWSIPGQVDDRLRYADGRTTVHLRNMSLQAQLPVLNVETGLMTSHWGLGMLANDGVHEPYFGLPEFGDRVIRARVTTKPAMASDWYLTGAIDRVIQDELTVDPRRQWTQQGILSLLWKRDAESGGVYAVARRQEELDAQRQTTVGVLDVYVDLQRPIANDLAVHLGCEGAVISGKTDRSTSYESRERLLIRSAGASGFAMLSARGISTGAGFGYASGDADPADDQLNDFTFDRNHGVGMVLFDEVQGAIEAATHQNLINPEHAGVPPDAVEATVTEGAFRRASYLQPRLEIDPVEWLHIRAGWLLAWSTAPIMQPFYTARNGGIPVNHLDQKTHGHALGSELDWMVRIKPFRTSFRDATGHGLALDVQGGHAQLSANLGGGDVHRYVLALRVN